jgi:hypothetical protein
MGGVGISMAQVIIFQTLHALRLRLELLILQLNIGRIVIRCPVPLLFFVAAI